MHSIRLNIEDSVFDKVIYFLQNLPKNEVSIVETKIIEDIIVKNEDWDYWSEEEISNFGKYSIGLSSNDFDDDYEDYSTW